jgi:hypothetical protein
MSSMEDVKEQEQVNVDVPQECEKSILSSQEEVVFIFLISLHSWSINDLILHSWNVFNSKGILQLQQFLK